MPQKSLLLVDDEPLIRESLARELASATLAVTVAASGEEAVARLGREWFDVVVSDLVMPGLDGFQVLKAAKGRDRAIAVILLTGFGDMDTAIDALRLGADDFLRKPCEVDELCWRIGNCLKKQGNLLRERAAGVQLLRQDPPRPPGRARPGPLVRTGGVPAPGQGGEPLPRLLPGVLWPGSGRSGAGCQGHGRSGRCRYARGGILNE